MSHREPYTELQRGDKFLNFVVEEKIGEGAYGFIYMIKDPSEPNKRAALKIEPRMKNPLDETLMKEVVVLKRLQDLRHVCRYVHSGQDEKRSFLLMTLLGRDLAILKRRMPDRRFSAASVLKIGIQLVQALRDVHKAGFVHRDVKPSNFAVGHQQKNLIHIFNFGMARQLFETDKQSGEKRLREPRQQVKFHGTVRYYSINVHDEKEPGRHDDLWSVVYMLTEFLVGKLQWAGFSSKESGLLKKSIPYNVLFENCPSSIGSLAVRLSGLRYHDEPPYTELLMNFMLDLGKLGADIYGPFEWEKPKRDEKPKEVPNHEDPTEEEPSEEKTTEEKTQQVENDADACHGNDAVVQGPQDCYRC